MLIKSKTFTSHKLFKADTESEFSQFLEDIKIEYSKKLNDFKYEADSITQEITSIINSFLLKSANKVIGFTGKTSFFSKGNTKNVIAYIQFQYQQELSLEIVQELKLIVDKFISKYYTTSNISSYIDGLQLIIRIRKSL